MAGVGGLSQRLAPGAPDVSRLRAGAAVRLPIYLDAEFLWSMAYTSTRIRRRRRRRSWFERYWRVCLILAAAGAIGIWLPGALRKSAARPAVKPAIPTGYIASVATVAQEYTRFYGTILRMPEVEQQLQQANDRAAMQDYAGAVSLLEAA